MIGGLTNHLWQSTLFAVAAGLLAIAFRKNRAQIRYWLWLSASLKFLVPFSLLMSLGSHLEWAPTAKIATQAVSFTMVQITQPFPDALSFVPSTPAHVSIGSQSQSSAVWVCGFGVIALMRFKAWLRIRAAVRSSTPLEIPATVEVRSSPGLLEPGVVGLFRPVLLLPAGIVERLTPPQLDGGACPRVVPRPATRQLDRSDPHDRRGGLLVSSIGVVDRCAAGGRARASLRRRGSAARAVNRRSTPKASSTFANSMWSRR